MYESPIEMIIGKIQTQMDDDIVKAVQAYHINVNKDELVKALRYDRDQYNNGYTDGRKSMTKCGEWKHTEAYPHKVYCSNCFATYLRNEEWAAELPIILHPNYCPNCGASMQTEQEGANHAG